MKKTMIAVAALAAGAASAQVTLSGNIDARFQSYSGAGVATDGAGFLISDAQFKLSASEDLGGGLKATAWLGVDGGTTDGTDSSINGDGVYLGLTGGFGTVSFSSLEGSDYLAGDLVTKYVYGGNGGVADRISWSSPVMSGFNVVLTYNDANKGADLTSAGKLNNTTSVELYYANGPLTADVGSIAVRSGNALGAAIGQTGDELGNTTRVRAAYDLGVAKVGYGMVNGSNKTDNVKIKETALTAAVPLSSALAASAAIVSSKTGTATALKGTYIGLTYSMSARTSLAFESASYDASSSLTNARRTRLTMSHKF